MNILVTGVSNGIGKSLLLELGRVMPEATVIALTRSPLDYDVPTNAEVHTVDLVQFDEVKTTIAAILEKHKHIDVLINNAGNGWRGMIEDTTIAEAKSQLDVNIWALMHLTQLILPAMRRRKSGHIMNISSVSATINYGTIGYYSATKAFLEKISEVMAVELEPWNIHVSLVAPGAVKTKFGHNMINIKQYGKGPYKQSYREWGHRFEVMFQKPLTSEQAAQKVVRLISHPKRYSYLTTRDAIYCYAKKLLPRKLFDHLLLKRYMHL